MAQVINTNIASLNAQRNLNTSQTALATALQRLSSGLRINSAKDDAAGLAISERFTTQIRGLNQAMRNANDGSPLAQTGEGSLAEITQNLQRIRELSVQSANATNSNSDRGAIDLEVQQRLAEIDRIANQTSFNGRKILDGSFGNAAFQIGANVGETISIGLTASMRTGSIGAIASATSVDLDTVITAATPAVAGSYTSGQLSSLDFSTAGSGAVAAVYTATANVPVSLDFSIDQVSFDVSVNGGAAQTVTLNTNLTAGTAFQDAISAQLTGATASIDGGKLVITSDTAGASSAIAVSSYNGDVDIDAVTIVDFVTGTTTTPGDAAVVTSNMSFTIDGEAVAISTNYTGNQAGLIAEIQAGLDAGTGGPGVYVVAAAGAAGFSITSAVAGSATPAAAAGFNANSITGDSGGTVVPGTDLIAGGSVTVASDFNIQIGTGSAVAVANGTYSTAQSLVDAVNTALGGNAIAALDSNNLMTITANDTIAVSGTTGLTTLGLAASSTAAGSLTGANVLDVASSNFMIQRIDSALTTVSTLRSTFGAIQNRFESTIANLSATTENLTAARSRIQDADFAMETAALTRGQILQQAGIAMLAQANALPNNVLALLR